MICRPFASALKSSALMRSPGERKGRDANGLITGAGGTGLGAGPEVVGGCGGGGAGGGAGGCGVPVPSKPGQNTRGFRATISLIGRRIALMIILSAIEAS